MCSRDRGRRDHLCLAGDELGLELILTLALKIKRFCMPTWYDRAFISRSLQTFIKHLLYADNLLDAKNTKLQKARICLVGAFSLLADKANAG